MKATRASIFVILSVFLFTACASGTGSQTGASNQPQVSAQDDLSLVDPPRERPTISLYASPFLDWYEVWASVFVPGGISAIEVWMFYPEENKTAEETFADLVFPDSLDSLYDVTFGGLRHEIKYFTGDDFGDQTGNFYSEFYPLSGHCLRDYWIRAAAIRTSGEIAVDTYIQTTTGSGPLYCDGSLTTDPCNLFDGPESAELSYIQINPVQIHTIYFEWPQPRVPGGWPGVEIPMPEFPDPWVYTAEAGSEDPPITADCSYIGYPGRLYCDFVDLPQSFLDSYKTIELSANQCDNEINYSTVFLAAPQMPPSQSSSGDAEENSSSSESFDRCAYFEDLDMSVTMLSIAPGTTRQTIYLKIPGGVPGPEKIMSTDLKEWKYSATLGSAAAEECTYEGYAERLYCTFDLTEAELGTYQPLNASVTGCPAPFFTQERLSIIKPAPGCIATMEKSDCEAAGGEFLRASDTQNVCNCP